MKMKSFYCVLYLQPNTYTGERYAIALLMFMAGRLIFDYDGRRLGILDLLHNGLSLNSNLRHTLENIKIFTIHLNENYSNEQLIDIKGEYIYEKYLDYLNVYSMGLLRFGNIVVFKQFEETTFDNIFLKFFK